MESTRVFNGVPSLSMFTAKRKRWAHVSGPHAIDISMSKGDVNVAQADVDEDISLHLSLSAVVKMLFAESKYPDLCEGEFFAVSDILINHDREMVTVIGNVIKEV